MTTIDPRTVAPGTYRIVPDPHGVRFHAGHVFGLGPVHGTLAIVDGTVVVAERPEQSRVTATVDAASFTTDKPRRDRDVRSKRFLDTGRYPRMSFTGTRLHHDVDRGWLLSGELTVHGTTAPVTFTIVQPQRVPDGLRCRATARIDRYAFGVTAGRGIIGRYLNVELDIRAAPADGDP